MGHLDDFMPPDNDEIIELIKLVEESDIDELHLEMGGFKLSLSKNTAGRLDQLQEPTAVRSHRPAESEQIRAKETPDAVKTEPVEPLKILSQKDDKKEADIIKEEGLIPIKSPLLGIFYRSPQPGAPPFIEMGSCVTEEDTVCLVEVMKLFNTVKAGLKGRIVKICAENNDMVEYNQTLFLVEPDQGVEASSAP